MVVVMREWVEDERLDGVWWISGFVCTVVESVAPNMWRVFERV